MITAEKVYEEIVKDIGECGTNCHRSTWTSAMQTLKKFHVCC